MDLFRTGGPGGGEGGRRRQGKKVKSKRTGNRNEILSWYTTLEVGGVSPDPISKGDIYSMESGISTRDPREGRKDKERVIHSDRGD